MMTDDALYGMVGLAHELGMTLGAVLAMPYREALVWNAYFARRNAEESVR